MSGLQVVTILLRLLLQSRAALAAENLALRQQVAVLQRSVKRPRLHRRDRIFWVWLSRLWRGWRSSLLVVQPETVIRWHREGFRLYWRWKSRKRCGRPKLDGTPGFTEATPQRGPAFAERKGGRPPSRGRPPPSIHMV